jgi:hypothetical protein
MQRDSVHDPAQMAVFTRQDGYTDRHAHGGAIQGQRDEAEWYHVGRQTVREGGSQTCPTIDGWKHVVIGSHIFLPDFSERSEAIVGVVSGLNLDEPRRSILCADSFA